MFKRIAIHSARYIYAKRLYLMRVPLETIKDILGVDQKTINYLRQGDGGAAEYSIKIFWFSA